MLGVSFFHQTVNMGPNACNWIVGAQESHENALQTGWTSNITVWCKNETPHTAISIIQSQFYGELQFILSEI